MQSIVRDHGFLQRLLLAGLLSPLTWADTAAPAPILVKVVVVTMFEIGKLTGDKPGEAQFWVERDHLDRVLPFPAGEYELRMNDAGVLLICTGGGVTNSSSSIMALGLDPRFDLTKAYWLVAGIAGGDPNDVSLGTAAWAKHVVDGDLLYEIDAREIPADWPYGMLPLGAKKPNDLASGWTVDTIHYALNRRWWTGLTRSRRTIRWRIVRASQSFGSSSPVTRPRCARPS